MLKREFRSILEKHLLAFFPGAYIERGSVPSGAQHQLVSRVGNQLRIAIKSSADANYRLVITRSQRFAGDQDAAVTEFKVISSFAELFSQIPENITPKHRADLLSATIRRVIAKSLCTRVSQEEAVLTALDQLTIWATRLYEGRPISAAIGFVARPSTRDVHLEEIGQEDFCAVLSNGSDTMLVCDYDGKVKGYEALPRPRVAPSFAPYRLAPIAHWARSGRIAIALNRSGEILVFRDQQLIFVRRRGQWNFLAHQPALTQMRAPHDLKLRRAIYESALDASFARTGACIGIVTSSNIGGAWKRIATKKADYLLPATSPKAKSLRAMIGRKYFRALDRRFRQELLAIDGALLVSHRGSLLTVGAILKIKGGSSGGGRLAAAQELSRLGLGIKVSQDGPIRGYRGSLRSRGKEPSFLLM
jgi:hypothetical protein